MTKWKIPLYKISVDKDDVKSVSNVIRRGMDWAIGPEIELFEKLTDEIHKKLFIALFYFKKCSIFFFFCRELYYL